MTALKGYQRLESTGIWREGPDAQRRDVVVSLGDATLVIMDTSGRALAHWAIPAVARLNPGQTPPIYHPDGDPTERLELPEDEVDMIAAIEKLRKAIHKDRPRSGRVRWLITSTIAATALGLAVFWLPEALRDHAVTVAPRVKRAEIGEALLSRITRVTGPRCKDTLGSGALVRLKTRLFPDRPNLRLVVVPGGAREAAYLPGGTIVLNKILLEDYEDPAVVAGYALVEAQRARSDDPLGDLLHHTSLISVVRFLTSGDLPASALDSYAEWVMTQSPPPLPLPTILNGFEAAGVAAAPYAYALDTTGESVLGLIEADPYAGKVPPPLISDGDWISLQNICEG
jgi:hypothetical protein